MCSYGTFAVVMYMICMYSVQNWMNESLQHVDFDMSLVKQVSSNWLVKPFVDITVTKNEWCPSSHPDLVF